MLFKNCAHYSGDCPCLMCDKDCNCDHTAPKGYTVDTDKLCDAAKTYCENGREEGADNG